MKGTYLSLMFALFGLFAQAQNDSEPYSYFVAGHTYGAPGVKNSGFHPPFEERFPYIQSRPEIEFGVLTGDIVSANPIAQDWDEIDADIATLGLPVHFAVGNHDMENRPLFESRYGETYYDFTYNNDLFIILDPNIDGWSITGPQLEFLENVVSEKSPISDNVFVFFHQILWRENDNEFNYIFWNSAAGRVSPVNFWPAVVPIFESIANDVFMFAGDYGASWSTTVSFDHYNNITLIGSGMGDLEADNIVVVNVDSDKSVTYDLICLSDPDPFCLGELTDFLTVDITTSTNEEEQAVSRFIYPNPANRFFKVAADQEGILQLFDAEGRLVLEMTDDEFSKGQINVSQLQKGIYTAQLLGKTGVNTQKLVIQ